MSETFFDYLLLGRVPSEEDMALTQQGKSSAPVGQPRDASAIPLGVPFAGTAAAAAHEAAHDRGQLLRSIGREESGVDELQPLRLLGNRRDDFGMPVTQARNGRSPARVDVATAIGVEEKDAIPANGDGGSRGREPMKDVPRVHYARLTSSALASMPVDESAPHSARRVGPREFRARFRLA